MKDFIKERWGLLPIIIWLIVALTLFAFCALTGWGLRSAPLTAMMYFFVVSLGILILWGFSRLFEDGSPLVFLGAFISAAVFIFIAVIGVGAFRFFFDLPEKTVEKFGINMLRRDDSVLYSTRYDYYEYKGILFYGKLLGHESGHDGDISEWYFYDKDGNLLDSSENVQEQAPCIDTSVFLTEHSEPLFTATADDFISFYDELSGLDLAAHKPTVETNDNSPASDYLTLAYTYSQSPSMWTFPTVSVYTPSAKDNIQMVTVNYDDHSYSEETYATYEEMCVSAVKTFLPGIEDEKAEELCKTLNQAAYDNVFQNEDGFKNGCVPVVLYYNGSVGFFPYFAIGECMHFCIAPINDELLGGYRAKGTEVIEIQ